MITVYTDTNREASLYGEEITEEDARIYDDEIGNYFDWLMGQAADDGKELEISYGQNAARSWSADTAEEEDWMLDQPDFWGWYQMGAPKS